MPNLPLIYTFIPLLYQAEPRSIFGDIPLEWNKDNEQIGSEIA